MRQKKGGGAREDRVTELDIYSMKGLLIQGKRS